MIWTGDFMRQVGRAAAGESTDRGRAQRRALRCREFRMRQAARRRSRLVFLLRFYPWRRTRPGLPDYEEVTAPTAEHELGRDSHASEALPTPTPHPAGARHRGGERP